MQKDMNGYERVQNGTKETKIIQKEPKGTRRNRKEPKGYERV